MHNQEHYIQGQFVSTGFAEKFLREHEGHVEEAETEGSHIIVRATFRDQGQQYAAEFYVVPHPIEFAPHDKFMENWRKYLARI